MLNNSLSCDLRELASLLRKERLFVSSEQECVEHLNSKVSKLGESLAQLAWVAAQQRRNLQNFVLAKQDCLPTLQAQRNYSCERLKFLEAGPILGYNEASCFGEFLASIRVLPELNASCLASMDRTNPERVPSVLHVLSAGLYGSCILAADKRYVLQMLRHLANLQLAPSDNPRRLLRHGTCAFARLYSTFHENLHNAQLFLTAALHDPIMALLAEDEIYLDVDPEKGAAMRSPSESPAQRREYTVRRLVFITGQFVSGLRDHLYCFPPSVSWLLRQLVSILTKADILSQEEIYEICTDLVLTHFICPAIVNPEPHGIIDAPVSLCARSNLIQVAQILQILAMSKYKEWDVKLSDLFSQFEPDCVSNIISSILESNCDGGDLPVRSEGDLAGVARSTALITQSQLNLLVNFFQTVASGDDESVDRRHVESLLSTLPHVGVNGHGHNGHREHRETSKPRQTEGGKRPSLLGKAARNKAHSNGETTDDGSDELLEPVLILRLPGETDALQLLTETKVLEMEEKPDVAPALCVVDGQDLPDSADTSQSQEKRTRFSLSHDEGSIGNTSDNLEAISEAASNHSGASSLESENEDQNDNLSDMVSANVSGRGSPNISGRDTPSSQITEGEAPDRPPPVPHPVPKQSRSDIEDKFGKFEIKKQELMADETVSLVSDTWSTDVLASDSETVDQGDRFPRLPDEGPPHPFIQHSLDISETASEAWSTDVMASDSERLTEVDTDDTASVARSDDTAASETGARGDDPGTPPPATFRPISRPSRNDDDPPRVSLAVPASPTRGGDTSGNVTGRGGGKADYKRRTMEFVGSLNKPCQLQNLESPRMIHVIDKMDGTSSSRPRPGRPVPRSPHPIQSSNGDTSHLETGLAALSLANLVDDPINQEDLSFNDAATPPASSFLGAFKPTPSSSFVAPPKFPEPKNKQESEDSERVFLSSTSLASTSSSSSNAASTAQHHDNKAPPTGAIPKSISFDKTADKDFLDDKKQKKSFFGNLKMSFKNRKVKKSDGYDGSADGSSRFHRSIRDDSRLQNGDVEEILAKYRGKGAEDPDLKAKRPLRDVEDDSRPLPDESIFINAKRKLRIVFSQADLQSWPTTSLKEKELISFLELQLAEARSLQNRGLVSQLHETLRCIKRLKRMDADVCRRLVAGLRADLASRIVYAAYLTRWRQILLSRSAHLQRLIERVHVDTRLTASFLISLCVRLFLERRDERFLSFTTDFRALTLPDEKTDLLDNFLAELSNEIERDPAWQGISDAQKIEALSAVETTVLSRVYQYAFYPNGDADMNRDQVLHEHVKKLSEIIHLNHKDLQIPKRFHGEYPWPSAQAEISALAAFKTPGDKVACISRCAATIMNLLALASEGSVPAADEFLPVFVFVIIMANPPGLLSTVQYVESFCSRVDRLDGEKQYWWIQFCSAIELIKTMEYHA